MISVKKNIERPTKTVSYDPYFELVVWHDDRQRDFHEAYRLRPKIESLFSALKRAAQRYCWSRGRPHKGPDGERLENAAQPCTAWINEALCKFIFMNLRTTARLEERPATASTTSFRIDSFQRRHNHCSQRNPTRPEGRGLSGTATRAFDVKVQRSRCEIRSLQGENQRPPSPPRRERYWISVHEKAHRYRLFRIRRKA